MAAQYFLAVYAATLLTSAGWSTGPFRGLIACEKAAGMAVAAAKAAQPQAIVTTVCLRKTDLVFKWSGPK